MFSLQVIIFASLVFIPMFGTLAISFFIFKRNRKGRRSPLTGNLLRSAGESLRAEIENISEKIDDSLFSIFFSVIAISFPILIFADHSSDKVSVWPFVLLFVFYYLFLFFLTKRLYSLLIQRRNFYLGLDAELAIGQELNQLMLENCRVFHDFPAESFNIDHVVVGPGGVFAIETKGRAKPDKGRGRTDAIVAFDGKVLSFPDWQESKPLDQALRQANWLQKWLRNAVGEPVAVRPVLALPGWFIKRIKPGSVFVINGKDSKFMAKPQNLTDKLEPSMIQRISYQLEQRCRDVEPVAYKREKKV